MRDTVLLVRRKLSHRAAVAGDDEDRVVAEATVPARRFRDLAMDFAIEELDVAVRRRERGHVDEARRTVPHSLEEREQPRVALLGRRVLTEVAAAADAWGAAQRGDLKTGVVGDRLQSARHRIRASL